MAWQSSRRKHQLPRDWPAIRRRILARDYHVCQIRGRGCEGRASEVDHIRRGDDHSERNLRAVCRHCHAQKSTSEGLAAKARLRKMRLRPAERHPGER